MKNSFNTAKHFLYNYGRDASKYLSGAYQRQRSVSLCTAVKNRLEHLQTTVLQNLADNQDYQQLEIVILNYNCPNPDTESWIKSAFSQHISDGRVSYYRLPDSDTYRYAHAKNLAFRLAKGELLCNVDADNFTGPGFAQFVSAHLDDGHSFLSGPRDGRGLGGRIAVKREHFYQTGGYDERINNWGADDAEFSSRLTMLNLDNRRFFKSRHLEAIQHSDELRTTYAQSKDKWQAAQLAEELISENRTKRIVNPNGNQFGLGRVQRNFKDWVSIDPVVTF